MAEEDKKTKPLESAKTPLPTYLLDSKTKDQEGLPPDVIEHIGTFEDSKTLRAHFQVNKYHGSALYDLLNKRPVDLPLAKEEWAKLYEDIEDPRIKYWTKNCDDVEKLSSLLMAKDHDMARVFVLRKAIKENSFALIHYLQHQGVDINAPFIESVRLSYFYPGVYLNIEAEDGLSEIKQESCTALDEVIKEKPFPANKILHLYNLGFAIKDFGGTEPYDLLKKGIAEGIKPSNLTQDLRAAAKLVMLQFKQIPPGFSDPSNLDFVKLSRIIQTGQYFPLLFFKKMEILFLIRELKRIPPQSFNLLHVFADERESKLIRDSVSKLKQLSKEKVTSEDIEELEKIKEDLGFHSTPHLNEKPSNLQKLIASLKRYYPYLFQKHLDEHEMKLKSLRSAVDFTSSSSANSTSSSTSSSCSSSSSSTSSSSIASTIDRTMWKKNEQQTPQKDIELTTFQASDTTQQNTP